MRSHGTEIPSAETIRVAAEETIRMHEERRDPYVPARCAQCPDDPADCPQYRWAKARLAMLTEEGQA